MPAASARYLEPHWEWARQLASIFWERIADDPAFSDDFRQIAIRHK
jgi:hypothetical protein